MIEGVVPDDSTEWQVDCLTSGGYIGMWLSMYKTWKIALHACSNRWILTFESDVRLTARILARIYDYLHATTSEIVWLDERAGVGKGYSGCCTIGMAYRAELLPFLIHNFDPTNKTAYWNGYSQKKKTIIDHPVCLTDWAIPTAKNAVFKAFRDAILHNNRHRIIELLDHLRQTPSFANIVMDEDMVDVQLREDFARLTEHTNATVDVRKNALPEMKNLLRRFRESDVDSTSLLIADYLYRKYMFHSLTGFPSFHHATSKSVSHSRTEEQVIGMCSSGFHADFHEGQIKDPLHEAFDTKRHMQQLTHILTELEKKKVTLQQIQGVVQASGIAQLSTTLVRPWGTLQAYDSSLQRIHDEQFVPLCGKLLALLQHPSTEEQDYLALKTELQQRVSEICATHCLVKVDRERYTWLGVRDATDLSESDWKTAEGTILGQVVTFGSYIRYFVGMIHITIEEWRRVQSEAAKERERVERERNRHDGKSLFPPKSKHRQQQTMEEKQQQRMRDLQTQRTEKSNADDGDELSGARIRRERRRRRKAKSGNDDDDMDDIDHFLFDEQVQRVNDTRARVLELLADFGRRNNLWTEPFSFVMLDFPTDVMTESIRQHVLSGTAMKSLVKDLDVLIAFTFYANVFNRTDKEEFMYGYLADTLCSESEHIDPLVLALFEAAHGVALERCETEAMGPHSATEAKRAQLTALLFTHMNLMFAHIKLSTLNASYVSGNRAALLPLLRFWRLFALLQRIDVDNTYREMQTQCFDTVVSNVERMTYVFEFPAFFALFCKLSLELHSDLERIVDLDLIRRHSSLTRALDATIRTWRWERRLSFFHESLESEAETDHVLDQLRKPEWLQPRLNCVFMTKTFAPNPLIILLQRTDVDVRILFDFFAHFLDVVTDECADLYEMQTFVQGLAQLMLDFVENFWQLPHAVAEAHTTDVIALYASFLSKKSTWVPYSAYAEDELDVATYSVLQSENFILNDILQRSLWPSVRVNLPHDFCATFVAEHRKLYERDDHTTRLASHVMESIASLMYLAADEVYLFLSVFERGSSLFGFSMIMYMLRNFINLTSEARKAITEAVRLTTVYEGVTEVTPSHFVATWSTIMARCPLDVYLAFGKQQMVDDDTIDDAVRDFVADVSLIFRNDNRHLFNNFSMSQKDNDEQSFAKLSTLIQIFLCKCFAATQYQFEANKRVLMFSHTFKLNFQDTNMLTQVATTTRGALHYKDLTARDFLLLAQFYVAFMHQNALFDKPLFPQSAFRSLYDVVVEHSAYVNRHAEDALLVDDLIKRGILGKCIKLNASELEEHVRARKPGVRVTRREWHCDDGRHGTFDPFVISTSTYVPLPSSKSVRPAPHARNPEHGHDLNRFVWMYRLTYSKGQFFGGS